MNTTLQAEAERASRSLFIVDLLSILATVAAFAAIWWLL